MKKNEQYELDDRFSLLEERIRRLESVIEGIVESKTEPDQGFATKPDIESFNALGIATVAQIYLAKKANR